MSQNVDGNLTLFYFALSCCSDECVGVKEKLCQGRKQCSKLHMLCNYEPRALQKWGILSMPSPFYITMTISASVSSAVQESSAELNHNTTEC